MLTILKNKYLCISVLAIILLGISLYIYLINNPISKDLNVERFKADIGFSLGFPNKTDQTYCKYDGPNVNIHPPKGDPTSKPCKLHTLTKHRPSPTRWEGDSPDLCAMTFDDNLSGAEWEEQSASVLAMKSDGKTPWGTCSNPERTCPLPTPDTALPGRSGYGGPALSNAQKKLVTGSKRKIGDSVVLSAEYRRALSGRKTTDGKQTVMESLNWPAGVSAKVTEVADMEGSGEQHISCEWVDDNGRNNYGTFHQKDLAALEGQFVIVKCPSSRKWGCAAGPDARLSLNDNKTDDTKLTYKMWQCPKDQACVQTKKEAGVALTDEELWEIENGVGKCFGAQDKEQQYGSFYDHNDASTNRPTIQFLPPLDEFPGELQFLAARKNLQKMFKQYWSIWRDHGRGGRTAAGFKKRELQLIKIGEPGKPGRPLTVNEWKLGTKWAYPIEATAQERTLAGLSTTDLKARARAVGVHPSPIATADHKPEPRAELIRLITVMLSEMGMAKPGDIGTEDPLVAAVDQADAACSSLYDIKGIECQGWQKTTECKNDKAPVNAETFLKGHGACNQARRSTEIGYCKCAGGVRKWAGKCGDLDDINKTCAAICSGDAMCSKGTDKGSAACTNIGTHCKWTPSNKTQSQVTGKDNMSAAANKDKGTCELWPECKNIDDGISSWASCWPRKYPLPTSIPPPLNGNNNLLESCLNNQETLGKLDVLRLAARQAAQDAQFNRMMWSRAIKHSRNMQLAADYAAGEAWKDYTNTPGHINFQLRVKQYATLTKNKNTTKFREDAKKQIGPMNAEQTLSPFIMYIAAARTWERNWFKKTIYANFLPRVVWPYDSPQVNYTNTANPPPPNPHVIYRNMCLGIPDLPSEYKPGKMATAVAHGIAALEKKVTDRYESCRNSTSSWYSIKKLGCFSEMAAVSLGAMVFAPITLTVGAAGWALDEGAKDKLQGDLLDWDGNRVQGNGLDPTGKSNNSYGQPMPQYADPLPQTTYKNCKKYGLRIINYPQLGSDEHDAAVGDTIGTSTIDQNSSFRHSNDREEAPIWGEANDIMNEVMQAAMLLDPAVSVLDGLGGLGAKELVASADRTMSHMGEDGMRVMAKDSDRLRFKSDMREKTAKFKDDIRDIHNNPEQMVDLRAINPNIGAVMDDMTLGKEDPVVGMPRRLWRQRWKTVEGGHPEGLTDPDKGDSYIEQILERAASKRFADSGTDAEKVSLAEQRIQTLESKLSSADTRPGEARRAEEEITAAEGDLRQAQADMKLNNAAKDVMQAKRKLEEQQGEEGGMMSTLAYEKLEQNVKDAEAAFEKSKEESLSNTIDRDLKQALRKYYNNQGGKGTRFNWGGSGRGKEFKSYMDGQLAAGGAATGGQQSIRAIAVENEEEIKRNFQELEEIDFKNIPESKSNTSELADWISEQTTPAKHKVRELLAPGLKLSHQIMGPMMYTQMASSLIHPANAEFDRGQAMNNQRKQFNANAKYGKMNKAQLVAECNKVGLNCMVDKCTGSQRVCDVKAVEQLRDSLIAAAITSVAKVNKIEAQAEAAEARQTKLVASGKGDSVWGGAIAASRPLYTGEYDDDN